MTRTEELPRRRRVQVVDAYVDVDFPFGATLHLPLIDVSGSGVGFRLPAGIAALSPGSCLECVLALRGREIPGTLEVARNDSANTKPLCGARFRARRRYSSLFQEMVSGLERGNVHATPSVA